VKALAARIGGEDITEAGAVRKHSVEDNANHDRVQDIREGVSVVRIPGAQYGKECGVESRRTARVKHSVQAVVIGNPREQQQELFGRIRPGHEMVHQGEDNRFAGFDGRVEQRQRRRHDERIEYLLLGGEVVIDSRITEAAAGRDLPDGRSAETFFQEEFSGRFEDATAGEFAPRRMSIPRP